MSETEVLQVVELLQDDQPVYIAGNDPGSALTFTYDRLNERKYIRIIAAEDRFLVFINGGFAAEVEMMDSDWEITTGDLPDSVLQAEILRRIRLQGS